MQWKTAKRGKKAESTLRKKLVNIFDGSWERPLNSREAKRLLVKEHGLQNNVGNLVGMGTSVWAEYIQGNRPRTKKDLPEPVMQLLESFVDHHYDNSVQKENVSSKIIAAVTVFQNY